MEKRGFKSQIQHYRRLLSTEKRFLQLGRVTSRYLVNMYSRFQEERLDFIAKACAFLYKDLVRQPLIR